MNLVDRMMIVFKRYIRATSEMPFLVFSMASSALCVLVLFSALFLVCVEAGDPPIHLCINDMTKNASDYLRWTYSIDSELADFNYTQDYTAPMLDLPRLLSNQKFQQVPLLEGSSLHKVRIDPSSPQGIGQHTNLQYLLMLDINDLLYSFRNNSGINNTGVPYGGWEAPNEELRGHFVGHYLSATAKMWASTHNNLVKQKMEALVDALAECQEKIGSGYLSAFPVNHFTRFESYYPVWAPYYTMHKIMAGLLDQYTEAQNEKALKILVWMVQYFSRRVENYIQKYTVQAHYQALNEETGGMNDVLYDLYKITADPEHLRLAHLFDKPCFLGPLALKQDTLSGFHANTHLPIIIGSQKRYEVTGEEVYKDLAVFFMDAVNASHRFITGGTSDNEFWKDPNRMGTSLGRNVEESCSSYNMLKVARNLFRATKNIKYVDYYERLVLNGVLTIQRGEEPGVMIYMLPMGPGMSKTTSNLGWGDPFDSFWCCYGTGIESFSKLGDSIYFEDHGLKDSDPGAQVPVPALYVVQFVPSTLQWDATGLIVKQTVKPLTSYDPNLEVAIELLEDPNAHVQRSSPFEKITTTLNVRIPSWTSYDASEAYLNDELLSITPGTFLSIETVWKAGDKLRFKFPAQITLEHVQDDRSEFKKLNGFMFGPYVLAGMSRGEFSLGPVNTSNPSEWTSAVPQSDNDRLYSFASGEFQLGRFNGSLVLDHASVTGTDWDFEATFKISTLEEDSSNATSGLTGKVVSLESMEEPGKVVAHSGINNNLVMVDISQFDDGENALSQGNLRFKVVPGLSGDGSSSVSFESQDLPGCFIHADDWRVPAQLKCKGGSDTSFASGASFQVEKGLASYHPMSFVAQGKGGARSYLMFPQNSYRDEHYAIYFDMS